MEAKFKVAMDKEQAALKNHYNVELNIDMSTASREDLEKYALKAFTVELQGQIRPNWDAFVEQCKGKTFTKSIVFGDALFESGRGKVSQGKAKEAYKDSIANLTPIQKLKRLLDDGMITDDIYQASVESLYDKGIINDQEMEEAMEL